MRLVARVLLPLALCGATVACEGRPRSDAATPDKQKHSGPSLVILDLSDGVPEQASSSVLALAKRQGTFDELVERMSEIAKDRDAKGVFVRFGDVSLGLARAAEIGETLEAVKQTGKPVFCHANGFTNATLYAASRACTKIYVSPAGDVEAIGLAAEIVYLHKLLAEDLHVSVDILQVGKFKGAEEPLTRDGPSDAARMSLTGTLSGMRESWVSGIRGARGDAASAAVEDGPYSPPRAKALRLVDEVGYADEALEDARKACGAVRDDIRFGRGVGVCRLRSRRSRPRSRRKRGDCPYRSPSCDRQHLDGGQRRRRFDLRRFGGDHRTRLSRASSHAWSETTTSAPWSCGSTPPAAARWRATSSGTG